MRLSIIVPALNEAAGIQNTLCNSMAVGADEVIVVDGGSVDATPEIACEMGCRVIRTAPGRAVQMNAGAKVALGDALVFLHADTLLPEDARSRIEAALADPEIAGGRFDIRLDASGWIYSLVAHLVNLRSRLTGIATGDQAIFVRRDVFAQLGGYPEIPLMEDVALSRRIKNAGGVACLRSRVVTSARRWQRQGPLKTIFLMWCLRLLYFLRVSPTRLSRMYLDVR